MVIVAARVHHSLVLAGIVLGRFLMDRQGIHIRTKEHITASTGCSAVDSRDHTSNGYAGTYFRNPERFESLADELCRLEFLKAKFRVLVQIPAIGHEPRLDFVDVAGKGSLFNHMSNFR